MADQDRVTSLIRTIAADPALRVRLSEADDSKRSSILSELGYSDVTPTDVANSAQLFVPQAVEEIDEDQLASVAGGVGGPGPACAPTEVSYNPNQTTVTAAASAAVAT